MTRLWLLICTCLFFVLPAVLNEEAPLLDQLLGELGCGQGACNRLGSLARAALREPTDALRDAARNINEHNAERSLHRWVNTQIWRDLMPQTYEFLVKAQDPRDPDGLLDRVHSCLLPHEVFHTLHSHGHELFEELFTGGVDNLVQWWAEAQRTGGTWYTQHPTINANPDPATRVPYGLHGDDAGVHGQEQVLVFTWGSVVHRKPTLDNRIVFTMLRVRDIAKQHTMQTVYDVLKWSLDALASGKFPAAAHNGVAFTKVTDPARWKLAGQPLAGGYVGCWAEMRGDWKFLREALHLNEHYGASYAKTVNALRDSAPPPVLESGLGIGSGLDRSPHKEPFAMGHLGVSMVTSAPIPKPHSTLESVRS